MSPLDSAFLRLEDARTSLHIASVGIFDGPAPTYDEMYRLYAAKLPLMPRYRQRAREVPLRLGRPVWVDDPHFSLGYHLRHTALPRPGSMEQLRTTVSRLMSQQLDRGKPLWEAWIIEGLEGGRWALVSKLHHCMADGIAGTDLMTVLLDQTPEPAPPEPDRFAPGAETSGLRLLAAAPGSIPHRPTAAVQRLFRAARNPRDSALEIALTAQGMLAWLGLLRPAAASSLCGPITPHRSWGWSSTTLDEIRVVRHAFGGTVNDVVLAAVTRGFRDLLLSRKEEPDAHAVRTLVPVSVRREDVGGHYDNRVSAMIAQLPVGVADPVERLEAVRAELDRLKRSGEAQAGEVLTEVASFAPPPLLSVGLTGAFRFPQRHIITVTTNVPGPRVPLYAVGRRLREYYPYVPIADRVRIGVAITSYDGVISFGVTADEASTPDLAVLIDGITDGMRELLRVAQVAARRTGTTMSKVPPASATAPPTRRPTATQVKDGTVAPTSA